MKRLFIIGNGFDIDHNLKTKYLHFKEYLKEQYPGASDEDLIVPESFTMPDGEEKYNDEEVIGFLLNIIGQTEDIGDKWQNLEEVLGRLNYDDCFYDFGFFDDDENEWHVAYRNEDISANILGAVKKIKEYFSEWISTIRIDKVDKKESFSHLINPNNDLFLTFNYTETLEAIYKAKNVFHIHGKQGGELIFGHGNNSDYYDEYMNSNIGSENNLSELQAILKKDTQNIISKYKPYFKLFGEVDEIYSYGFSFSDVDMAYIKEICNLSPTENIIWYINDSDIDKLCSYKEKIIKCGFKGKFDIFKV